MSTIRLSKFADEGVLRDVTDAEFLRTRKIGPEDVIDFSGVTSIAAAFLDALFAGREPESLLELIQGAEAEVAEALEAWLDRRSPPTSPTRRPSAEHKPSPSAPPHAVPALELSRVGGKDRRYTPTRLVNRLREQLTRYIEGAYPLNDPVLIQARRKLLEHAAEGRLLAQEPFVETTPRYKTFQGDFSSLGLRPELAAFLGTLARTPSDYDNDRTLLYPRLYTHQAEAIGCFLRDGQDLVVATGTGSGKTECFLIPMLGTLYEEALRRPASFEQRAVRCLILYPMNALVNDQLSRLRLLFGSEAIAGQFRALGPGRRHPAFGMYTGRTLYPGPRDRDKDEKRVRPFLKYYLDLRDRPQTERALRRLGRYPAKDLKAFLGEDKEEPGIQKTGKRKGAPRTKRHWSERLRTGPLDRELLTRQEMVSDPETGQGAAPDILVTNYSMLEYMLMRPFERPVFEQTRRWLRLPENQLVLVLDEAHMYRGAKGAEVAFLLRRLMARLGVTDQPDKVRVICTSASLGNTDEARERTMWFAADLTGKPVDAFRVVFGEREIPEDAAPGSPELARTLAAVDLDALHVAVSPETLGNALQPVFAHLGVSSTAKTDDELLHDLHGALKGRPFLHQVLKAAAGTAIPLAELADNVFPLAPERRQATEVLLTLGTLARTAPEEPGLLPTRLHMIFRGLGGLYACVNERCKGRQAAPGKVAPVGRLYTEPRTHCDDCGSRVFELASCRDCGTPYLLGYSPEKNLNRLEFLWGEMEGQLARIQLLPREPRNSEQTAEIRLQLSTGTIDHRHTLPALEVRSLWVAVDTDGLWEAEFERCPVCVPAGSRRQSRILDFRTRGEQPFTALIEAQFSEQPPQKKDPGLPNQGRKVLVFSDGRQKAARLAPALETSHARDAFRQVLALAIKSLEDLGQPACLNHLYPALLKVCTSRGVNLYPENDETIFHTHLRQANECSLERLLDLSRNGSLQPTLSYLQSLYGELTDPFFSLYAIGLAMVREDPLFDYLFKDFPSVGLSGEEAALLFRQWLRVQLERRCFLPAGATPFKLGEKVYDRPEGIRQGHPGDLLPRPFPQYLEQLVGDSRSTGLLTRWFEQLLDKGIVQRVNDQHYLQLSGLVLTLKLGDPWLRCSSCNRLYPEALRELCPDCLGVLVPASSDREFLEARSGYYRSQIVRALQGGYLEPFGLITAEHSAQLTGLDDEEAFTKTEEYELRFQDIPITNGPPIDVLSCTTTMEVGIDIGTLSGVALRNVPPHVANYQQRAGRAGRRGRSIASVITYAHGGSHDAWYYQRPARIISGEVRPPVVYVENQKVLERHINAWLMQVFFHETLPSDPKSFRLFESFGTVETFLSEDELCSFKKLESWLKRHEARLKASLREWIPTRSFGLRKEIDIEETLNVAVPRLLQRLRETLPFELYAQREEISVLERESLEKQVEENLLQHLIDRAIFPRYAFPTDTVSFWVPKKREARDPKYKRKFEYQPQRDLQIALTEYAPGRTLTIDKWRFTGAALYSPYQPVVAKTLKRARAYTACKACGYMSLSESAKQLASCPACGHDRLDKHPFVTPEGFAPDVNLEWEIDRGGTVSYAGMTTPARLELQGDITWDEERFEGRLQLLARPQHLVVVNKGIGDRGFMICPACGLAEPVWGPGFTRTRLSGKTAKTQPHKHPLEEGVNCSGTPSRPYFLGHKFPTHVLLLRLNLEPPVVCRFADREGHPGRPARTALTSLAEALCLAATRTLQIDEGELAGNWRPVENSENSVDLYLYDLLPGGAGYTHQVKENLEAVFWEAVSLLTGCDCESSCYRCLRHYENQIVHGSLDRFLALDLLQYLLEGRLPELTAAKKQTALRSIGELLRLKGIPHAFGEVREQLEGPVSVPLVIHPGREETWIEVHHPLVDPEVARSPVLEAAEAMMMPVIPLDSFTLVHDLPAAYEATGMP